MNQQAIANRIAKKLSAYVTNIFRREIDDEGINKSKDRSEIYLAWVVQQGDELEPDELKSRLSYFAKQTEAEAKNSIGRLGYEQAGFHSAFSEREFTGWSDGTWSLTKFFVGPTLMHDEALRTLRRLGFKKG